MVRPQNSVNTADRACLEYARSMPGAVNLKLEAGDFCLYRNTLWHVRALLHALTWADPGLPGPRGQLMIRGRGCRQCGVYHPSKIRATIHDGGMTAEFRAFAEENRADAAARRESGLGWRAYQHEYVGRSPPVRPRL